MKLQPIDTIPETGEFFVYRATAPHRDGKPYNAGTSCFAVMVKRKNEKTGQVFTIIDGHFAFDLPQPTHWTSALPEPPEEGK